MQTFENIKKKMTPLINICKASQEDLLEYLPKFLTKHAYKGIVRLKNGYVYAKGELPIMLVAHLDTVHTEPVKEVFINMDDLDTLSSPQGLGGDDRCGVYIITKIIQHGYRPSILFVCDEEIGCLGSQKFCDKHPTIDNVNFIVEFDRRGNEDVVRYDDDNLRLTEIFEEFGFVRAYGSCSDISYLAPHFKVSAVNLSSGYYHEHYEDTTIKFSEVKSIIKRFEKFLNTDYIYEKIEYKEKKYTYTINGGYNSGYDWRYYYNRYNKYSKKGITQNDLIKCDCCGNLVLKDEVKYIEGLVCCEDCARQYMQGADLVECQECGALVYADSGICSYCGSPLIDDYGYEEREEEENVRDKENK